MKRQLTWKDTQIACYIGYVTQAIIINLPALLFVTFRTRYGVTLTQLSFLVVLIFVIQIAVDFLSAPVVDKIGYRPCTLFGLAMSVLGLLLLSLLPKVMANTYAALLIALSVASIGSGMMEVLISPINESLPRPQKDGAAMSLLHSFYCWGVVAVVLLSTAYFAAFGTENWMYLPLLWAAVPLAGLLLFVKAPLYQLTDPEKAMSVGKLFATPVFWLMFLLMVCAGASEQAMSQWASLFAETGLGVSKAVGDLMGPCAFAVLMGTGRVLFGGNIIKWAPHRSLIVCALICIVSYLLVIFSPWPLLSLVGCALCGFAVSYMWPGTFTLSSGRLPYGGTAMFALLAMGGDLGCSLGPAVVGAISDALANSGYAMQLLSGSSDAVMKIGFLLALVFPVTMALGVWLFYRKREKEKKRA